MILQVLQKDPAIEDSKMREASNFWQVGLTQRVFNLPDYKKPGTSGTFSPVRSQLARQRLKKFGFLPVPGSHQKILDLPLIATLKSPEILTHIIILSQDPCFL